MANNNQNNDVELDVVFPPEFRNAQQPPQNTPNPQNMQNNNQFGMVRDRLFHAMLVKIALSYNAMVGRTWRRIIEFISLVTALTLLLALLFVHLMFARSSTTCFDHVKKTWPREGILRVEVIRNLDVLLYKEKRLEEWKAVRAASESRACEFDWVDVLRRGPMVMPSEVRHYGWRRKMGAPTVPSPVVEEEDNFHEEPITGLLWSYLFTSTSEEDPLPEYPEEIDAVNMEWAEDFYDDEEEDELFEREFGRTLNDPSVTPVYEYRAEYTLLLGLMRLKPDYRRKYGIPEAVVRIDAESSCFGDPMYRNIIRTIMGYEDSIISSLRTLSKNDKDIGYLHDLRTNDLYHVITTATSKWPYFNSALVMILFVGFMLHTTFAISMLLRFSHHQIFLFIVDLLHMFELNQPLVFPAAPLLTVILALVGMEAIMSEVFADTTTAFYVILVVWIADQFDAICCHSPISKRYWLRFFYLYQFFFYAYQQRFGAHYGSIALLTSSAFIIHSMIFFFHHYEMPLIMYQDRLQRILNEIQHNPPMNGGVATAPPTGHHFHNQNRSGTEIDRLSAQVTFHSAPTEIIESTVPQPRLQREDSDEQPEPVYDPLTIASERLAEQLVSDVFGELEG